METVFPKCEEDDRCRVCLDNMENTINLLERTNFNDGALAYWDILLSITNIQTVNNHNAPQKICSSCAVQMEASYEFKLLCENSDKILQSEEPPSTSVVSKIESDFKIDISEECISSEIQTAPNLEEDYTSSSTEVDSTEVFNGVSSNYDIKEENESTNQIGDIDTNTTSTTGSDSENTTNFNKCGEKAFPSMCSGCNYEPTSATDYQNHWNIHRNGKDERECSFCEYTYVFKALYMKHLHECHLDRVKECNLCKNIYFTNNALRVHMKQEHPDKKIFPDNCELCDFIPESYVSFTKHMRNEHGQVNIKKCRFCDYTTDSSAKLGRHVVVSHNEKRNIQCTKCDKKFLKNKDLNAHMRGQHDDSPPIICEICGNRFKTSRGLKQHMDLHNGIKNYECKECGKRFTHNSALYIHAYTHTDERTHKCKQCGAAFKRAANLRVHIRTVHEQVKRFPCTICPVKFICNSKLQVHLNVVHGGMRNYKCETCGKLFGDRNYLVQHQIVHTGERRHICEICGSKFTQAHVLRSHLKTHSSNNV